MENTDVFLHPQGGAALQSGGTWRPDHRAAAGRTKGYCGVDDGALPIDAGG